MSFDYQNVFLFHIKGEKLKYNSSFFFCTNPSKNYVDYSFLSYSKILITKNLVKLLLDKRTCF